MAGQRGRDVLIKVGDGATPETFATLAGIRTSSLVLSAGPIDASGPDSPEGWRQLFSGAGLKSAVIEGAGVFKDAASDETARQLFFSQAVRRWRLAAPGFGVFEGPFLITRLEYSGAHEDEVRFSIALVSAGAVDFDAV